MIRTKKDVILAASELIDSESLGGREIALIQEELSRSLRTSESPASIARTLADHGVRLRHPEVLESDSRWREHHLYSLFAPGEMDFGNLAASLGSIQRIIELFESFQQENDSEGKKMLNDFVLKLRAELLEITQAQAVSDESRQLANEVSEWLLVWLQNPSLFLDWLSLRLDSPDLAGKFGSSASQR